MHSQSSCFRWSPVGEWEWSSKAVDSWQRVRKTSERKMLTNSFYIWMWDYITMWLSGFRQFERKTITCISMPSLHGAGASSPPTQGWCCMQTGLGWSSQTLEWVKVPCAVVCLDKFKLLLSEVTLSKYFPSSTFFSVNNDWTLNHFLKGLYAISFHCHSFVLHLHTCICTSLAVSSVASTDSPLSKQGYKLYNNYVDNIKWQT